MRESAKAIWEPRKLGDFIKEIDWSRPPTRTEVLYLLNYCYPFLEILNVDADFLQTFPEPEIIRADTGWMIHQYGDLLFSTSRGELLFSNYFDEEEGEEGGAIGLTPGQGTVVNQAFNTAIDVMTLVKQKGWKTIEITDGTKNMMWAAWAIAKDLGITVEGYEPNRVDKKRQARLKQAPYLQKQLNVRMKMG